MFSPERNLVESAYHLSIEFRVLDIGQAPASIETILGNVSEGDNTRFAANTGVDVQVIVWLSSMIFDEV